MESKIDLLKKRAAALIQADRNQRNRELAERLTSTKGSMNARGLLNSNLTVNAICEECVTEIGERARHIFDCITRTYESIAPIADENTRNVMSDIFVLHFSEDLKSVYALQQRNTTNIAKSCLSDEMLNTDGVTVAHVELMQKYRTELDIYEETQRQTADSGFFDRLRQGFINNKLVAAAILIALGIVFIATFVSAISDIQEWARRVFDTMK